MSTDEQISRNVRAALGGAKVSQRKASEAMGMSYRALSNRVNGHISFSVEDLRRIAQITDVDFVDLVRLNEEEKN